MMPNLFRMGLSAALWGAVTVACFGQMSLVIGIDGLGSGGLVSAVTPNIDSLMTGCFDSAYSSAYSLHAFAGGPLGTDAQQTTVSGPGWSSILTGVWVDRHRVSDNSFAPNDFQSNPTYLELLEEGVDNLYSVSLVNWGPIKDRIVSSVNDADSHMDWSSATGNDPDVALYAAAHLRRLKSDRPAAVFVAFDDVDAAGHSGGSSSRGYLSQIAETDAYVGQLLDAIRGRQYFHDEDWQIIVVSDHGHRPTGGHGGQTALERTIPFIVSSPATVKGVIPAAVNQPAQVDTAATVLSHFQLEIPKHLAGVARGQVVVDPRTIDLSSGLIAHLPLDGDATSGLAGADADVIGSVNFSEGRFGQAAGVRDYGDGYIRLRDDLAAQLSTQTDFSMSFWMRFEDYDGDPAVLSNKNWQSGQNTGINLALNPDNTLDFNSKAVLAARQDLHPYAALKPESWQSVLFTVDRDGPTTLYIGGALQGQIETSSRGSFDGDFLYTLLNDGTGQYDPHSTVQGLQIDEFAVWNRLLTLDEISVASQYPLTPVPLAGDFDANGILEASDIDVLTACILDGKYESIYDLDSSGSVDNVDRENWVEQLKGTFFGDANLDGQFDSGDMVHVFQINRYEDAIQRNATWSTGDWDGDGEFMSSDLVFVFQRGAYERDPRSLVRAVPEPSGLALAVTTFWGIVIGSFCPCGAKRPSSTQRLQPLRYS